MTLVKDKPKTAREDVRHKRRAYVSRDDTLLLIGAIAWKHRVGLLLCGYPISLAAIVLAFIL